MTSSTHRYQQCTGRGLGRDGFARAGLAATDTNCAFEPDLKRRSIAGHGRPDPAPKCRVDIRVEAAAVSILILLGPAAIALHVLGPG